MRYWAQRTKGRPNIFTPAVLGADGWWDARLSTLGLSTLSVDSITDLIGNVGTATETGANRMTYSATGWDDGGPCFDLGSGGTVGATTPSVALGVFSVFGVVKPSAGSEAPNAHASGGDQSFVYGSSTNPSSYISRGGVVSGRGVSNTWLSDGSRHSYAVTFGGTHATHKVYLDGVDTGAASTASTSNPGTTPVSGTFLLGYYVGKTLGLKGKAVCWALKAGVWSATEIAQLHLGAQQRGLL